MYLSQSVCQSAYPDCPFDWAEYNLTSSSHGQPIMLWLFICFLIHHDRWIPSPQTLICHLYFSQALAGGSLAKKRKKIPAVFNVMLWGSCANAFLDQFSPCKIVYQLEERISSCDLWGKTSWFAEEKRSCLCPFPEPTWLCCLLSCCHSYLPEDLACLCKLTTN